MFPEAPAQSEQQITHVDTKTSGPSLQSSVVKADGIRPEDAEREASLVKATFTGLVLDLLATGHRKRLTEALECALSRLDDLSQLAP